MEAYTLTDIDRIRTMSQDYIYSSSEKVSPLSDLFLMADGMGDHRAGDYAPRFAAESPVIYVNEAGDGSPVMQLKRGTGAVNGMLYEESLKRKELKGMGCTLVAGVVKDNILYVTNMGDNRLYFIHGDSIRWIIRGHPCVEEMVAIGRMRRGSEGYDRHKNVIIRALGTGREVESDFFEVGLEEGDYILLCSDGPSNMLEDQFMYDIIIGEGSFREEAALLIETANCQGGVGNIAMVLINPSGREVGVCQLPEHISRTVIRLWNALAQAACP